MKKQFKIGVIGCSAEATAILRGIVLSDYIREKKIIVCDSDLEKLDSVKYLGVNTTTDGKLVAENSEFLIFAVNPAKFGEAVQWLGGVRPEKVISVMTGVTKSEIKNSFGVGLIKVARAVLNAPCSIGSGAIAVDMLDFNKNTDDTDFISNVFGFLGTVVSMEESKLNAVTGLSGNIVYPLMLLDAMIDAGVNNGLVRSEAQILAVQSVMGASELISQGEQSIGELLKACCKNNPSALEAVKTLEDSSFRKSVASAIDASVKKVSD